jgi:hypothetical protein
MGKISAEYLAGLVDGEGYIGITKVPSKIYRLRYSLKPIVQICMANADELLWEIAQTFGAYYFKHRVKENCKPQRTVVFKTAKIKPLLEYILPHLHVKNRQATLVLEFQKLRQTPIKHYDETILRRMIEIYNELRVLNHRGLGNPGNLLSTDNIRPFNARKKELLDLLPKRELEDLYWGKKLMTCEIAKLKGCHVSSVKKYMRYYRIPLRNPAESAKLREEKRQRNRDELGRFI